MRWGTLPGLSRQSWPRVASSAAWLRAKSKRNAMGLDAAPRKSGAEVVQGCRTGQRAAWMHGVATAARQFFGVQNVAYSGIMTIYRSYRINHLTGAADASSTAGTSYKRVTPDGVPEEVEKWFTQTVEQAKLYGTPWSPDTHQRIEELEERVREVEASQQLLLPPSAQPLVLPAPAQQRTKAAWRKRR